MNGLRFAPDGLHLVSFGTDDRLRLWDAVTGKNTLVHTHTLSRSLGTKSRVCLQVNYGRLCNTLQNQNCPLGFSPLPSTLQPVVCVPVGGEVVMLDMMSGKKIKSLSGHFGSVHSLVVHPVEQV